MKKFIEIGNASKDCPYCYSDGDFVVCTENPKCKMTKQNEGEQPNLSSVIKNLYDSIEKKLIERLTFIGVDVNEASKRVTRIITQKSNIIDFRHEFWLDYNSANRELLFFIDFNFSDVPD
jgi:hypothetical protein